MYKKSLLLKFVLLFFALGLAAFLAFGIRSKEFTPDHKIIFALDINRTMNTQDVLSGDQYLSRMSVAKQIIADIVLAEPWYSYGLVLFNAATEYIVPPTFDMGTFFLYLIGITTNLLPDGPKNFDILSGVLGTDDYASTLIVSDFDTSLKPKLHLPLGTSLIGLGSLKGDTLRTAQGIRYYDNGKSVSSARNDSIAKSFGVPYTTISDMDGFVPEKAISRGISLPLSQRIFLYAFLGVIVVLFVFL